MATITAPVVRANFAPRTVPGGLVEGNRNALAFGRHVIAYGCNGVVVVVSSITGQCVQVLEGHRAPVTCVAWAPLQYSRYAQGAPTLVLASADSTGRIIVWDVETARILHDVQYKPTSALTKSSPRAVRDLQWMPMRADSGQDMFISLYYPSPLVLWDMKSEAPIWKVDFSDKLISFSLDPFRPSRMVVLTEDSSIIIVDDLNATAPPTKHSPKYNLGDENPNPNIQSNTHLLEASFCPHERNQLFLMYPRELLTMDLDIHQTVSNTPMERTGSSCVDMCLSMFENTVYILHENGTISARKRDCHLGAGYTLFAQSEQMRLKSARIHRLVANPFNEKEIATVATDGTLYIHHVGGFEAPSYDRLLSRHEPMPTLMLPIVLKRSMFSVGNPVCIKAQVPLEDKPGVEKPQEKSAEEFSLIAVGTTNGMVQVFDPRFGTLVKQFNAHNVAIKGMDWIGMSKIVSFSCDEAGPLQWRNKVAVVDLQTGIMYTLREKQEPTMIVSVHVSPLGQYLIIVFKDKPLELWDFTSLLKTMPSSFPFVAGLDWCKGGLKRGAKDKDEDDSKSDPTTEIAVGPATKQLVKEHFVVSSPDGQIFHYTVEGSVVRTGARFPSEPSMTTFGSIVWKSDLIILGDSSGTLHVWDLKQRVSKNITTTLSGVQQICFTPRIGSTRALVRFNDGVGIYDVFSGETIASKKFNAKDNCKPISVAWSSSERPVIMLQDGCMRIFDAWLETATTPIYAQTFRFPLRAPYGVQAKVLLRAKSVMQHQPHRAYALPSPGADEGIGVENLKGDDLINYQVNQFLGDLPIHTRKALMKAESLAERCLVVAQYFGDLGEVKFWSCVLHYMSKPRMTVEEDRGFLNIPLPIVPPSEEGARPRVSESDNPHLPPNFNLTCDNEAVRSVELERLDIRSRRKLDYDLTNETARMHVNMGLFHKAMDMMLSTDSKNANFYSDSLRACVIAAIAEPETCRNTIKLVATNLIANGKLHEGVELLVLTNNGLDACRYLQTYGEWDKAARLAKTSLPQQEADEIITRHAENLVSEGRRDEAALQLVTIKQFGKAVSVLAGMHNPSLAGLFNEVCVENKLIDPSMKRTQAVGPESGVSLVEEVALAYARHLRSLGLPLAAAWICEHRTKQPVNALDG